jgi:hypothetical protein
MSSTTATASSSTTSTTATINDSAPITNESLQSKQPVSQMENSVPTNTLNNTIDNEPPAYSHASVTSPPAARLPAQNPYAEMLPSYEHAKIDMPPSYPKNIDDPFDSPIEPQEPWPLTKKLYIAGFLFWPLWFIGMGFCVFGKGQETRLWGRRCAYNSIIVIAVFTYVIIAYYRTGGRIL